MKVMQFVKPFLNLCFITTAFAVKPSMKGVMPKFASPLYKPKTATQQLYTKFLENRNVSIVLASGPAGTGKTLFACNNAIQELRAGTIKKIVITRPLVAVEEEELGFLPGNINKKMDPWTRPIMDIFEEFYSKKDIETLLLTGVLEISPLAYMRGRTFKHSYIIADEMQNSSPNQMLMLLTRIGTNSRMVITGDVKQTDKKDRCGLSDIIQKYKVSNRVENIDAIRLIEFDVADIERNPVIKTIMSLYEGPVQTNKAAVPSTETKTTLVPSPITNDCALIPKNDLLRTYTKNPYTNEHLN